MRDAAKSVVSPFCLIYSVKAFTDRDSHPEMDEQGTKARHQRLSANGVVNTCVRCLDLYQYVRSRNGCTPPLGR